MNESADRNEASVSASEFESLVSKGRSGDNDAIGLLLSKYRNYLLLIANQDLDENLRSKLGASDVVQESMMLAQQNFQQFRGDSEQEFLGWLKTILVNDMRNNRRWFTTQKRDTGLEINIQDQSSVKERLVDKMVTPSTEAMQRERAKVLSDALSRLNEDHRSVIELRNFQQLDFAEIGKQMGRSGDAARKLWVRAVEALQAILSKNSADILSGVLDLDQSDE